MRRCNAILKSNRVITPQPNTAVDGVGVHNRTEVELINMQRDAEDRLERLIREKADQRGEPQWGSRETHATADVLQTQSGKALYWIVEATREELKKRAGCCFAR